MATFYNLNSFKDYTGETYTGDVFNISHDGTAITLGNEPGISLDTVNLTSSWTFSVTFQTSSLANECVFSIDDGASGRFIDVYHNGGNTLTLHIEGESDISIQYTDEVTLPLVSTFVFCGIAYNVADGFVYLGAHIAGTSTTTVDPKFKTYTPTAAPTIPAGRIFRFFRPAVLNSNYFNGVIDLYRINSSFQSLPISHASYFVFSSVSQQSNWTNNLTNSFTRFTAEIELETEAYQKATSPIQKWSNFCPYDTFSVCAFARESFGSVITLSAATMEGTNNLSARNIFFQTINTGMHFFERNNKLVYVNMHGNGVLNQLYYVIPDGTDIQPTQKVQITTAAADGTFTRLRGDIHGRYVFGTKIAIDGTTHQFFRRDHDGLNEITFDCLTVLGVNAKIESHCINADDDLIYFNHPTTNILKSVDFDLTNYNETYTLQLNTGTDSSLEYSDGYLYFGNTNPRVFSDNSTIWRMELSTGDFERLAYTQDLATQDIDNQIMFVDRPNNRLIVSGNTNTHYIRFPTIQTVNNFAIPGFYKGFRDSTSIVLSWEPITGAIGYNLLQDNVIIENNTSDTFFKVTGLVDDTEYRFSLEYTTDGTTFLPQTYANTIYRASDTAHYFPVLPTLMANGSLASTCGFVDPYDPTELLMNVVHDVYKFDMNTGVNTLLGDIRTAVGNAQERILANKRIYHTYSGQTRLLDAGIELANRIGSANVSAYLNDNAFTVFDHALTSSPTDTNAIVSFTVSLDGEKIYYSTLNEDIWVYDDTTGVSTLVYDGDGSSNTRGLDLDPLDQESLVFYDNGILKHINTTTLIVTEVLTGASISHIAKVLDGVIYGARWFGSFFKVNVDGTGYEDLMKPGINFNGLVLDTINKRVILLEDVNIKVYAVPTMADLPDDPSTFSVTPRPISLDVAWPAVPGAIAYGVEYTVGAAGASTNFITSELFTAELSHSIGNLQPGTTYTVYLYYTTSSATPSILIGSTTKTTLANILANYDSSSYIDENGDIDLTSLNSLTLSVLGEFLNELFTTGDDVNLSLGGGGVTKAKFLQRGGTAQLEEGASIAIPFIVSAGASQTATLTLSDTVTNVTVDYDETTNQISVDGGTTYYSSGESFVLDGKKVTISTF